jgi:hypothetical protein
MSGVASGPVAAEIVRRDGPEVEVHPARWEHGSFFHLSLQAGVLEAPWSEGRSTLWGSGRDALRALLAWGREARGFERVLVPSFFCPEVVTAAARELPVAIYSDGPDGPPPARIEAGPRDVLLVVNTYGMRKGARIETPAVVLEDHTHDPLSPWAFASEADYAFASLRKTLPLSDGGVLWSPRGRALPPERGVTEAHAQAAFDRLAGMVLKRQYLEGHAVEKRDFRARVISSEQAIGKGDISGITPLSRARLRSLPGRQWREKRARNLAAFRAALGEVPGVRLLDAPFAATLLFDRPEGREGVRAALVEARVYPSVLWPLESCAPPAILERHLDLSRRVLSIHCDFRYEVQDMERVALAVRRAVAGMVGAM